MPTKNWQRTTYPESHEVLGHEAYHKTLEIKSYACAQCYIACGRKTTIKEGPYAGESGGGPEYETLGAFGFGFNRKDDKLPKRLLQEPAADGVGKGQVVDLEKVLDSYYKAMGWDIATGIPKPEKLEELNLDWMIQSNKNP